MCGIAGELKFSGESDPQADWEKISSMMARRGPDDSGIWSADARCTLVFRRLSILDLSLRGHQPMTACNGRYILVFNGEIYNFLSLGKELVKRGVQFHSTSDSEVLLHALIEWGRTALDKLNGMFALAFYDRVRKRLLLARDHAGIKPLYYLKSNKGIFFASQYNQLLAHPWCRSLKVSQEALGLYFRLAYIPAPYALLQGTHMLEPGMWLEVTADGHLQQGKYFTFPLCEKPSLKGNEAIEAIDNAITNAVKRHLVSDVPVGAFLSGGIDSPLVVSKMKQDKNCVIRAFTIGTGHDANDESSDAKAYARELGVDHRVEHITSDNAVDLINDVIDASAEPFGDYSIFPTLLVSRLASQEFKVMLSGDGGDELFWGYTGRFGPLLKLSKDFRSPCWLRKAKWEVNRVTNKMFGFGNTSSHLRRRLLGDCHRAMITHLNEYWLERIFPTLPEWPAGFDAFAYTSSEPNMAAQLVRKNDFLYHLPYVLMKVDRASMYQSLEVRVPLLDREVIAVAAQVDWSECLDVDRMIGKIPLRKILKKHLRHQTYAKRGFEVPMGTWLRTSLRKLFEESVLKRDEILGVKIDQNAIKALFNQHLTGNRDYAWGLWPLLSLSLWVDRYYRG